MSKSIGVLKHEYQMLVENYRYWSEQETLEAIAGVSTNRTKQFVKQAAISLADWSLQYSPIVHVAVQQQIKVNEYGPRPDSDFD